MEKSEGKYNLYKSPSSAALLTVVSAAIALFCISYTFRLIGDVGRLDDSDIQMTEKLNEIVSYAKKLEDKIESMENARSEPADFVVAPLSVDSGFSVTHVTNDEIKTEVEDLDKVLASLRTDKSESEVPVVVSRKVKSAKSEVMSTAISTPSATVPYKAKSVMLATAKDNFGQILASNVDSERVMISRGGADGVEPSQRFVVYRNSEYIGIIEVDRVFSTMSACKLASSTPKGIRVGDVVCKEQAGRARTISGG